MKRKALLILAAAILAVAMIPAIGVGAATGDVKIVTPDELANPSGRTGSAFDKLTETNFVSDKAGEDRDNLEDAGGTLYVVIEDDDATANKLTDHYAFFTSLPGVTAGGNLFLVSPLPDLDENGNVISVTGQRAAAVTNAKLELVGDTESEGDEAGNLRDLVVGNSNRDGAVDHLDIELHIGDYTPAVRDDVDTAAEDETANAVFTATRTLRPIAIFAGEATNGKGIFLNVGDIPSLGGGEALRLTFASAGQDVLEFTSGANKDMSLVEVTSSSGDPIRIPASEKDLGSYAAADSGVGPTAFEESPSKDSGVFVARFGVIRNGFKDAIAEYWEANKAQTERTQTFTVVTTLSTDEAEAALQVETGTTADITLVHLDDANTLVAGTLQVKLNNGNESDGAERTNKGTIADDGDGTATITVEDGDGNSASSVADTDDAGAITADTFTVTYKTELVSGTIAGLVDAVNATTVESNNEFDDDFCDSQVEGDRAKQCAEAVSLAEAIEEHSANLNIGTGSRINMLLDNVIGVEHGDSLSVRYSDQSPRSVRADSAQVDLNGPVIGGFTLANGAYIDEDDFEVLFDVTDADSGILEDSHDEAEAAIRGDVAYVTQQVLVGVGVAATENLDIEAGSGADLDVDDQIDDGERYELTIDVTAEAEAAEGDADTDAVTVRVKVTIVAYDAARNKSMTTVNYVVDTIDPEMQKAITGWGVKSRSGDAYVLVENQRDRIALVFDDTVQGDLVEAQHVSVPGSVVLRVTWLNNGGHNKLDVGEAGQGDGTATDLDYNAKTDTSGSADDVLDDLGLKENTPNQDARHILFLTLDEPLPSDATPTVEIDNNDLVDLAGNENRADHRSVAEDRLAPSFKVTVDQKLSNSGLAVTIEASESLDRRPRAMITLGLDDINLTPSDEGNNNYTVDTTRAALGISANGSQNGVWTVSVTGVDDNDNVGTSTAKWELDTRANAGDDPGRRGGNADASIAHELEVNDIIFLTVEFGAEGDEYGTGVKSDVEEDNTYKSTDSSKTIDVTGLTLETLADGDIDGKNKAKARSARTITATADVGAASAQTSDSVKHVVALADLEQGNYNLKVDYEDAAGNTGSFDYVFQVIAPKKSVIDITPGWTLISIPGRPQTPSIDAVFEGSEVTEVWSLNNATKAWEFARKSPVDGTWGESTLDQIVDGRGYFVRSATFDPVKVLVQRFSPQREPPMYSITAGWNSIGYTPAGSEKSIAVDGYLGALGISGWGMIRTWNTDATPPQYETYYSSGASTTGFPTDGDDGPAIVEAGKGYLLFATRAGSIGG